MSNKTSNERLHAICQLMREHTWAGIDESKVRCEKCPATIETPYGRGTQGCYLLAQEVYNIAVHGNPRGVIETPVEPPRARLIDLATELARYFTSGNAIPVTRAVVSTESDLYILLRECMPHWEFEKGALKTTTQVPQTSNPVTPPPWISVADRYPDVDQDVVYFFDVCGTYVGKYVGEHCFAGEAGFLTDDVTHWMPYYKPKRRAPETSGDA